MTYLNYLVNHMKETSFTTHKKKPKYSILIAFNVDEQRKQKLDECLKVLKVEGKRDSDKMRDFLDKVHLLVMKSEGKESDQRFLLQENKRLRLTVNSLTIKANGLTERIEEIQQEKEVSSTTPQFPPQEQGEIKILDESHLKILEQPKPQTQVETTMVKTTTTRTEMKKIEPAVPKQTPKPTPPLIIKRKLGAKYIPQFFTCKKDGKPYPPLELPCIKNTNYTCSETTCEQQVLELIGFR